MRELNQIKERLTAFISSIRWNVRSASILVIAALVIAVVVVPNMDHLPSSELEPLFASRILTQSELDKIEAVLGASELKGYRVEGGQLRIPAKQRSKYFSVLDEAGCLPESFHAPTRNAVGQGSLMDTSRQRLERMQHAKEREAELLIRARPGVTDAYVRFDETAGRGLRAEKLSTAIVGVTTLPNQPLDPRSVRVIQELLLGLKAGLSQRDITVQDLTAGVSFRGERSSSSLAWAQQNLEQQWIRKLSTILSFIPAAEIAVRVETEDARSEEARCVRVSVNVPSDYLMQLKGTKASGDAQTLPEMEAAIRAKIQAAILPLLPGATDDASQFVAVNFFDVPAETAIASSSSWYLLVTLIGLIVLACAGIIAVLRFTNTPELPKPTPLKVYASVHDEKSAVMSDEREQLQVKLRAYVDEDPDAAAKSLAEFIDRAS